MADALLRQLALVSESKRVKPGDLARVGAALQKQAARDVVQFWNLKATVDVFPSLDDVPISYWPIIIMDDIGYDAAGIHLDKNNEPFSLVTASGRVDEWSLTASHEMIEMLVDPWGNRMVTCDSPKRDQGRVKILVEPCDPSEAASYAYTVNSVLVSDFYTVRFFDPVRAPGVRYSYTGAIRKPREILPGGYVSWLDIESNDWWQATWFDGSRPSFRRLGPLDASNGSFRSQIDRLTWRETNRAIAPGVKAARAAGLSSPSVSNAEKARAVMLRQQIEALTGGAAAADDEQASVSDLERPSVSRELSVEPAASRRRSPPPHLNGNSMRSAPSVFDE
jgi:hypothetical protein